MTTPKWGLGDNWLKTPLPHPTNLPFIAPSLRPILSLHISSHHKNNRSDIYLFSGLLPRARNNLMLTIFPRFFPPPRLWWRCFLVSNMSEADTPGRDMLWSPLIAAGKTTAFPHPLPARPTLSFLLFSPVFWPRHRCHEFHHIPRVGEMATFAQVIILVEKSISSLIGILLCG